MLREPGLTRFGKRVSRTKVLGTRCALVWELGTWGIWCFDVFWGYHGPMPPVVACSISIILLFNSTRLSYDCGADEEGPVAGKNDKKSPDFGAKSLHKS